MTLFDILITSDNNEEDDISIRKDITIEKIINCINENMGVIFYTINYWLNPDKCKKEKKVRINVYFYFFILIYS